MFWKKPVMPNAAWWMSVEQARSSHTPDEVDLENRSHWLLFVTGETMRCGYEHEVIKNYEYNGFAFTKEYFQHWKRNLGLKSFDIPIPADQASQATFIPTKSVNNAVPYNARIKGELYLVPMEDFKKFLDKYHENGVAFQRKRITVLQPYRARRWVKEKSKFEEKFSTELNDAYIYQRGVQSLRAWMYTAIPEFWNDQLDGGFNYSTVRVYRPSKNLLGDYSYFGEREFFDDESTEKGKVSSM